MKKKRFSHYVGIDYSGASHAAARTATIQVYHAEQDAPGQTVRSPASTSKSRRNWNRRETFEWLKEFLEDHSRVIVGIDHGFSFPLSYFRRYRLSSWDAFLEDFSQHWPREPEATVDDFRQRGTRMGHASDRRTTEEWTSSAKSVFQFDVQGSVAKSTHAGLPFLHELRTHLPRVHFWPFDGLSVPANRSVVAEIYPSLVRNRYPRAGRSPDQQDAYAVCRWLQEMDRQFGLERFFHPPLSPEHQNRAKLEGWILGVT